MSQLINAVRTEFSTDRGEVQEALKTEVTIKSQN